MRSASTALQAFLAARTPCYRADLFTVTLLDGSVDRWTTFDRNVTVGSNTWIGGNGTPLVGRSALGVRNTMEIPELTLTMKVKNGFLYRGLSFRQQILNGIFDGALALMERVFMPLSNPSDTSMGTIIMFKGRKANFKMKADVLTPTIKGGNVALNQPCPKNVYQTACLHTFCDAGCTLSAAAFTTTNAVGSGSTSQLIAWGSVPGDPSDYSLGKIKMTSGAAAGQTRAIKYADGSGILISYPFDGVVNTGDTFSIMQGCDKTMTRCTALANIQHDRGCPFIPQATTAV
jgi:uncharacterized phage protein (TIGR02218 family)